VFEGESDENFCEKVAFSFKNKLRGFGEPFSHGSFVFW
jgi:hypothetical protein